MLNSQDLSQIRNVVKEEVDNSARTLRSEIQDSAKTLRSEIQDSAKTLRSALNKTAKSLRKEIKESADQVKSELKTEIKTSEERIYGGIGDFISDNILPQLAEKADKSDIDRIERKIDKIIDKDLKQDEEIRQLKTQIRSFIP